LLAQEENFLDVRETRWQRRTVKSHFTDEEKLLRIPWASHDGLLAALMDLFSATPRQRCLVHKQRNVLAALPRRERVEVQAELVGIWQQATKSEALTQLAAENRQVYGALS
jgi:transposase-like protein